MSSEIRHPLYEEETFLNNDFNLVLLTRKVSVTDVYVELNQDPSVPDDSGSSGDVLTVVGYGDTDPSDDLLLLSNVLMETDLQPVSNAECEQSQGLVITQFGLMPLNMIGQISENMMCARKGK
jgi:hypothetical protein